LGLGREPLLAWEYGLAGPEELVTDCKGPCMVYYKQEYIIQLASRSKELQQDLLLLNDHRRRTQKSSYREKSALKLWYR
jgi:hypothetical protein